MRIRSEACCALIIDVQQRLFPHIHEHSRLEQRLRVLARGLEILEVPVILTEQYRKGLGPTIPAVTECLTGIEPVEKASFSCCDDDTVFQKLQQLQRPFVVLAGIEAHICLLQTAMDLLEKEYTPVLLADAVSSRSAFDRDIAIERVRSCGGVVSTVESLLFELCRVSGTDRFRAISKLVK